MMMNPHTRLFVSITSWASLFVVIWCVLLGRLSGWQPFLSIVIFLFLGLITIMEPADKDEKADGSS